MILGSQGDRFELLIQYLVVQRLKNAQQELCPPGLALLAAWGETENDA